MKTFNASHKLTVAADRAIALITTEDYLHYRYHDDALLHFEITITRDDDEVFACAVKRVTETHNLPGIARKIVGKDLTLIQEHEWQRLGSPAYHGRMHIHVHGVPGEIQGDMRLTPLDEHSCEMSISGSISARVPLIGGQVEKMLLARAENSVYETMQAIERYVKERG